MPIQVTCEGCQRKLEVGDEHVGRQARCPICGTATTVPELFEAEVVTAVETQPMAVVEAPSWYLRTPEGQSFGPVTRSQLDQWVTEGRIASDCWIREENSGDWKGASAVYSELIGPAPGTYAPYESNSRRPASIRPHRGPLIFVLGVLPFCLPFAVAAWVMGSADLADIRSGRMDRSGETLTQVGMILGMVQCVTAMVGITVIVFYWLFAAQSGF